MSVWATIWAWEQNVDNAAQKLTLLALAHFADKDAICYPGQQTLAHLTRQSERSVRHHLERLESSSLIRRTARWRDDGTRNSDIYELAGGQYQPANSAGGPTLTGKLGGGQPADSAGDQIRDPSEKNTYTHKAVPWPDELVLTDEMRAFAFKHEVDPHLQFEAWYDYCLAKRPLYHGIRGWEGAWRNWVRNVPKYAGRNGNTIALSGGGRPTNTQPYLTPAKQRTVDKIHEIQEAKRNGRGTSAQGAGEGAGCLELTVLGRGNHG